MTALLQTADNDIAFVNGRLSVVAGAQEKAQKITNRLRLFLGEWFLDTRVGVPYYAVVFVKNPDLELVKRLLASVIESVPGIVEANVVTTYDPAARTLTYAWVATDDEGQTIEGTDAQPFIVNAG